jgi:NitT/TauT family transport system substrate-binding protein
MKKTFLKIKINKVLISYFFLMILILSFILFGIPGCSVISAQNTSSGAKNQSSGANKTIKIGLDTFLGYAYPFIAVDKGFFKNNGVDVELILSKDYSANLKLYENGETDGFFGVFPEVILYNSQGNKIIVVYVTDYSDSADVLIANPLFDSLEALKGKKIGIERVNSFSHLFVLELFKKAGIPESELQFEVVPSQEITNALDAGIIEAGHTWNPEKTKALNKGYRIVGKAGDVSGIITDVLALRDNLVKESPEDVLAIVKSVSQAREFLDSNPKEALQIMAKYEGVSAEEIAAAIKEMYLLDLQDMLNSMEPSNEFNSLYSSGAIISKYYMERGQITSTPVFDEIIDSSFIKKIFEDR